ncbi:MAG: glycosyltransferase family 4 protein [Rhodospirillales bacterium]|nr:glycosyltransferase family 4 protein [Alphaproteobacteria bacterium]MCB9977084.1 glycosyltransferase family 4 protein [Rhodospirillales bacterium]MCB9977846.1 glycosyltransferase family 4 protein [Rhodospirillales bacterium]
MNDTPFEPVIMQIVPELGAGGAEQGCIDIAAEIVRAGAKSIVVSNGGFRVPELLRFGAVHINLPVHSKNPLIMWRNIGRLQKLIRRHKVNIVHARSRAPAWSAYKACRNTDAHFITTCHAPYNISGEAKRLYNRSIAQGEIVIAISNYVAEYLKTNYALAPEKIRVIPRGIPIERFHPTAVTPERLIALSREFRIPEGSNIIMMPARLTRWKGHHILVDAIEKLEREDIFCLMIGADQGRNEYRRELEQTIAQKNLGGKIRIVDHCNDMPAAYMLSTVVVSASTNPEGFGRVPVEAQAMGRPIVATDHGGAQETILRGQTGWLVPPNDAPALARAIEEALSLNPMQRAVLATRSMAHVAAHFTREKMAEATLGVYAELLQGRLRSPMRIEPFEQFTESQRNRAFG